jgi:hypothetical protein
LSTVRVARCGVGALVIALALTACSSGGHGTTPKTTAPSGAAAILSFVVPALVKCGPAPNAKVKISYAVESARGQHVVIDGHIQSGTDAASNTISAPVPCDNQKHTVAFVVEGARGHLLGRVKYVTTLRVAG